MVKSLTKKLAPIILAGATLVGSVGCSRELKPLPKPSKESYNIGEYVPFEDTGLRFNDYDSDGLVDTIDHSDGFSRKTVYIAEGMTNRNHIFTGLKDIKVMSDEMRKAASKYIESVNDFRFAFDNFQYDERNKKLVQQNE